jgi:hypothetical protein
MSKGIQLPEKNKFDTIKMMREIHEKLSEKYWGHPDILKKEMEEIRKKYQLKVSK